MSKEKAKDETVVSNTTPPADNAVMKKIDMNTITQEQVPEILTALQQKLKQMTNGHGTNPPHITANLPGYGEVAKITDVKILIKLLAGIRFKAQSYNDILTELEINTPRFKFDEAGYGLKAWDEFLIYKIQELKNKSRIDKLKNSIGELENFLSEEDKFRRKFKAAISDVWDEEDLG